MRIADLRNFVSRFKPFAQANSITMAAKPKSSGKAKDDLVIDLDAWERFENAVDVVIKSGPKHKAAKNPKPSLGKLAKPLRSDATKNGRGAGKSR